MRQMILDRIQDIKMNSSNFSKSLMKWKNFSHYNETGPGVHISELDFNELDDKELLRMFERIIRRASQIF